MIGAIKWYWEEGAKARNGPEPYLRIAANFLFSTSISFVDLHIYRTFERLFLRLFKLPFTSAVDVM
jgi:hypothetical protein